MATPFVHEGPWDEKTRQHPATRMMEAITTEFDNTNELNRKWPFARETEVKLP